jgi:cardiolipin synthase
VPPAWQDRAGDLVYALAPATLEPGHEVQLLVDGGQVFPAMLDAIRGAQHSVCLETYILRSDRTGRRLGEGLVERARAGVAVRLLYDAIGGLGVSEGYLAELRAAGVQVAEFHPIAPWRPRFALNQRDHRKILVVDDTVGFTGGINIGDDYASTGDGGVGWRDTHCRIVGPQVHELLRLFRRSWVASGGADFAMPPAPVVDREAAPEGAMVRVLGNEGRRGKTPIRRAYLHAIRHASRAIDIANAYFIPDRAIRRALLNAVQRGVRVRVIVPGEDNDLPSTRWAGQHIYTVLLKGGVTIHEWTGLMMHAKTAVIDGVWSAVGSCNIDKRSFNINLEVMATIIDRPLGAEMHAQFELDLQRTKQVDLALFKQRPFWRRVVEWFWYQFRGWL